MSLIEPTNQQIDDPSSGKKYSASIRVWHWLNAIVISGSLITVLINATILKSRVQAPAVQDELKKNGANVTFDQARAAVHLLSDKIWDVHVYFGYALVALFLLRITAEAFQLADRKFISQIKKAAVQLKSPDPQNAKHELVVKSIYAVFYLLLTIMVITGLCLAFDDSLPFSKSVQHSIKSVHGFCMYPILAFIVVHLVGVILAERKEGKGIVSDMINGG